MEKVMSAATKVKATTLKAWEKHNLLGFVGYLETCDVTDDETFAQVVQYALEFCGIKGTQVAKQFEIDPSTISRWATGRSKPHRLVRPLVVEWIKNTVEAHADTLSSAPKDVKKLMALAAERD